VRPARHHGCPDLHLERPTADEHDVECGRRGVVNGRTNGAAGPEGAQPLGARLRSPGRPASNTATTDRRPRPGLDGGGLHRRRHRRPEHHEERHDRRDGGRGDADPRPQRPLHPRLHDREHRHAGAAGRDLQQGDLRDAAQVLRGAVAAAFDTLVTNGTLASTTSGRTIVTDAAGLVDANTVKLGPTGAGTAQTARDIGSSVLLSRASPPSTGWRPASSPRRASRPTPSRRRRSPTGQSTRRRSRPAPPSPV
jgi:hypothetical protein